MQASSLRARGSEFRRARRAKFLPPQAAREIGVRRRLGDHDVRSLCSRNAGACVMARHSGYSTNSTSAFECARSCKMFGGGEFVIERNEHAAREKYGVRRNQPLGLIGHDDRGAAAGCKTEFFERGRQRLGSLAEIAGT
jgi:hypothetical protein